MVMVMVMVDVMLDVMVDVMRAMDGWMPCAPTTSQCDAQDSSCIA